MIKKLLWYTIVVLCVISLTRAIARPASAACLTATINGNQTISSSCSVAADTTENAMVCGQSENSSNSALVTVTGTGITMTVTSGVSGTTIVDTASILATANAAISISCTSCKILLDEPITWVVDAEADGWSADYNTTYTATASGRRLRCLMRGTTADCNDAAYSEANSCYSYSQGSYYGYGQGSYYGYGQGSYYGSFYPQFSP